MKSKPVFIPADYTRNAANMNEFIQYIREGYRDRGHGAPAEPRTLLKSEEPRGFLTGYYAVLPGMGVMGNYTYSAGFESRDAWFVFSLFDSKTGHPIAVFDGSSMNPWKTGGCGGVAIDELAVRDAKRIGIYGSGPQAMSQLRAACSVRDIEEAYVFSPTESHRKRFADTMSSELSIDVESVNSPEKAAVDMDIIVTATNSSEPVFRYEDISDGTHINAIGQYNPDKSELDPRVVRDSRYVADLRSRLTRDSGEYIQALSHGLIEEDHVHGELGEVVINKIDGRMSSDDITVFDSGGTAIETTSAALLLYEKTKKRNTGLELEFMPSSEAMNRAY